MNLLIMGASLASLLGGAPSNDEVREKDLDLVEIREPNNAADENGFGTVAYPYRITREQISNGLYARFLNAVDPEGSNKRELYNSQMTSAQEGGIAYDANGRSGRKYAAKTGYERRPVVFVNWRDAARFANWIRNGGRKGSSTEIGAYNLRNPQEDDKARSGNYWIPAENEIYKAGFYLPLGKGRVEGETLYAKLVDGVTGGAVDVRVRNGWIPELVDPAMDPPQVPRPTLWFAGREKPDAEAGDVGFRLAAALTSELADDPEAEGDTYAGAPSLDGFPLFPLFFGLGTGGGSASSSQIIVPVEPPPAS
jgi:hypothetical protein